MKIKFIIIVVLNFIKGKYMSLSDISILYKQLTFDNHKKGTQIFISCFAKSGSTFLLNTLKKVTGFERGHYVYAYMQREQEIDLIKAIDNHKNNMVIQQHTRGSNINVSLMKEFEIQPVILVRNIFDIVVSFKDHLKNDDLRIPMAHVNESFIDFSKEKQYDFIIELIIPWYINFYTSWMDVISKKELKAIVVTYEQLTQASKYETIKKILEFYNIQKDETEMKTLLLNDDKKKTRFNKGVAGRGELELSNKQKDRIKDLTRFYPNIDFSLIGL